MSTPTLGPIEPYGLRDCRRVLVGTVVDNPDPLVCGRPATWHMDLTPEADASLMACDEHAAEARQHWHIRDEHPFGGVCGMPDTAWIDSSTDDQGRCVWMLDDDDLSAQANTDLPQSIEVNA